MQGHRATAMAVMIATSLTNSLLQISSCLGPGEDDRRPRRSSERLEAKPEGMLKLCFRCFVLFDTNTDTQDARQVTVPRRT